MPGKWPDRQIGPSFARLERRKHCAARLCFRERPREYVQANPEFICWCGRVRRETGKR